MKEQIKPCPFCGGKAETDRMCSVNETECLEYLVRCSKCGVSMLENSEEAAVSSWNTRKLPENKPLTLDEVKALKEGDVVWLEYNNDHSVQTIEFAGIVGGFFTYYAFGNEMLCSCYLTNMYKACKIYRNKPEEEQK